MKQHLWLAAATLVALAACSGNAQRTAQNLASSAPVQAKDVLLAATVATKFATIDLDSAAAVHVSAQDGTVRLTGKVRSQAVRSRFEAVAQSTGGARVVDDRTTVDPNLRGVRESLSDTGLAAKISAALVAQTGVNGFNVKVAARDGIVTLSGRAPSRAVKDTMLASARNVSGVRSVNDRIVVR